MQKLYAYVDETGQDTEGDFFIVSVVVTAEEYEVLREQLEQIEQATGKGRVKWSRAKDAARVAYIERVLATPAFRGKLHYGVHHQTKDYLMRTAITTA